ncbi:hypothetical protein SRB521_00326 [Intestinimonas butyriciproducens]|nr:hypothetical protein SRB521_00326 [Intestinimonas butyriciproducens]
MDGKFNLISITISCWLKSCFFIYFQSNLIPFITGECYTIRISKRFFANIINHFL